MTATAPAREFLSVDELADRYGIPKGTIYKWLHHGTGPRSLKIGRHRRFRLADVLAWEAERADDRPADAAV